MSVVSDTYLRTKIVLTFFENSRKKFYCKFNNVWFQFPSQKDVIVPQAEAMTVLGLIRKTICPSAQKKMDILTLNDLSSFEFQSLDTLPAAKNTLPPKKKIPTIAILGHFNHGKTTLLDAFCNTDLVSTELHGITQVEKMFIYCNLAIALK